MKVLIVGGGFGGVQVALNLARQNRSDWSIELVSDKPHFEYQAALYRVVAKGSPLEVCVPLSEIFAGTKVAIDVDTITKIDLSHRSVVGESGTTYKFDYLVLALGSETVYFDIPGLADYSFGFKSIAEALELNRHLRRLIDVKDSSSVAIIGGGPSGVELAGELANYLPSLISINLFEAAPRLLPSLSNDVSTAATKRLRELGVNIFVNRLLLHEDPDSVFLKDLQLKTKTVIWTAGVKPNHLYHETAGLTLDPRGRVNVDDCLRPVGWPNVFVIGDGAATPYTGMAQTAVHNAKFVARQIFGRVSQPYQPRPAIYALPIGHGWAVVKLGPLVLTGRLGWCLRRAADLRYFLSILPPRAAWRAFHPQHILSRTCPLCVNDQPVL